ncbi:hypothetical protein HK405_014484, partial [Cladochytrium tenue]
FACALYKLTPFGVVQGRLYVTSRRAAFYSNVLGWVERLSLLYADVASFEKSRFAGMLPNAIAVTAKDGKTKHVFYNFFARDQAFDLLTRLSADAPTQVQTDASSSVSDTTLLDQAASSVGEPGLKAQSPTVARAPDGSREAPVEPLAAPLPAAAESAQKPPTSRIVDLPDIRLHVPRRGAAAAGGLCGCGEFHAGATVLIDEVLDINPAHLWLLFFSDGDPAAPAGGFVRETGKAGRSGGLPPSWRAFRQWFLEADRGSTELAIGAWRDGPPSPPSSSSSATATATAMAVAPLATGSSRTLSYRMPLGAPVGSPRNDVTETLVAASRYFACVEARSRTPEVYLGDRFRTVTRTCVTTATATGPASTPAARLRVSYAADFDRGVSFLARAAVTAGMKPKVAEFHTALRAAVARVVGLPAAGRAGLLEVKSRQDGAAEALAQPWRVPAAWLRAAGEKDDDDDGDDDEVSGGAAASTAAHKSDAEASAADAKTAAMSGATATSSSLAGGATATVGGGGTRRAAWRLPSVSALAALVLAAALLAALALGARAAWRLAGEVRLLRAALADTA